MFPSKIPTKAVIEHEELFSSDGLTETTEESQRYLFDPTNNGHYSNSFTFTAWSDNINMKSVGMSTWIFVPKGMTFFFNNVYATGIIVKESGVTFAYHGGFYK